jgi:hypothetical protein
MSRQLHAVPRVVGLVLIALGVRACCARHPEDITLGQHTYDIESRDRGEAACFDLFESDSHELAYSACGSLDLLCDRPTIARFDVDHDGQTDLYIDSCSGPAYVTVSNGKIEEVELADTWRPSTWWGRQVLNGGLWLFGVGGLLLVFGVPAVVRRTARRLAQRSRPDRAPR